MTTWSAVGWLAQTSPTDPAGLIAQFGAFGAALAILFMWRLDTARERDRLLSIVEQQQPILVETRDVLRTASETVRAAATAMQAMSESLQRVPSEAELTRLRVALEAAERAAQRAATLRGESQ